MPTLNEFVMTPVLFAGLGAAAAWSVGKARRHRERMRELSEAQRFLEIYLNSLDELDDPGVPDQMMDVAIKFAEVLQDPRSPGAIAWAIKADPDFFNRAVGALGDADKSDLFRLQEHRPDLWKSFSTMVHAGIMAFTYRWPDCKPAFERLLTAYADSPVEEARSAIRTSKKAIENLVPITS